MILIIAFLCRFSVSCLQFNSNMDRLGKEAEISVLKEPQTARSNAE